MTKYSNPKFEVGDVVKLNAGGPEMSVNEILPDYNEYRCQWFFGKKLEEGLFDERSLILVRKQGTGSET